MKRIIPIIIALAIGLTACGESDPILSTPEAPEAPDAPEVSVEDEFLFDIDNAAPELYDVSPAILVELGYTICDSLAGGTSLDAVITTGIQSGLGDNAIAATIAAAVVNFCPEQQSVIDAAEAGTAY